MEHQTKEGIQSLLKWCLFKFLKSNKSSLSYENMAYGHVEQVLLELGFSDNDGNDWDTNGWEIDYWNKFTKENIVLNISGSMYYGTLNIEKNEIKRTEK